MFRALSLPLALAAAARWAPLLVAVASSSLLFWLVGLESSTLTVDSGPYLSIAHHLVEDGLPVSGFGFLSTFDRLPAAPGFLAPGLGLAVAVFLPFADPAAGDPAAGDPAAGDPAAGDPVAAARIVLWLSLFATQLGAATLLKHRTLAPAFATGASVLLVWHGSLGRFAGAAMTELPFVAWLTLASLAAVRALDGTASPRVLWGGLPAASAALCLTRHLGVFLPPAFSLVYLLRARRERRPWRRTLGYLAFYNAVSFLPLGLWLAAAARSGPSLFPQRPPSRLGAGRALAEAVLQLAEWIGPWLLLGLVLAGVLKLSGGAVRRSPAEIPGWGYPELFLALALAAYVGALIAARTLGGALYPLEHLGERYMLPAWPLAFFLTALAIHRWVWSRRRLAVRAAVAVAAALALWLALEQLLAFRLPPPFPTRTETYRVALELLPPETTETVLCNFCQLLVVDRPSARVIGIPSREDFVYEMDLPELVRRHGVGWIVLFDLPARDRLYPAWFTEWLAEPPAEVDVTGGHRLADGVIYRLESTRG